MGLTQRILVAPLSEKKDFSSIKDIYMKIIKIAIPVNILLTIVLFSIASYLAEFVFHAGSILAYPRHYRQRRYHCGCIY